MSTKIISKTFLIEDHDEALAVWRRAGVRNLDLVHIDAHVDFGFHRARPVERIFREAASVKELKAGLERSLAFSRFERDLDKQTNIGNYIYPAMAEGIVRDFYWVIPGGLKEFRESLPLLGRIIGMLTGKKRYSFRGGERGMVSAEIMGRRCVVCVLEKLPLLRRETLLDIDTDFMVIDSIVNADNITAIGKRKPWITPEALAAAAKDKVRQPAIVTVAYSVNGGYTPMRYKALGDRVAGCFSAGGMDEGAARKLAASAFFRRFESTGKKEFYREAVALDPAYRAADNNYGPLYLTAGDRPKAEKEFLKVLAADPRNPFCLCGAGRIALDNRDFRKARGYFSVALKESRGKLFSRAKAQVLAGLAHADIGLHRLGQAKRLLREYQAIEPLSPHGYYLFGRIHEEERDFGKAAAAYTDALRLGLNTLDILERLAKISPRVRGKNDIMRFVVARYKELRKWFVRTKKITGRPMIGRKIAALDKRLIERSTKGAGRP